MTHQNANRRWPLYAALLLGLAFRLLLWSQPLHRLANDEIEYVTVARDLLAGRGWAFYAQFEWLRAPLYPLFLAGSLWLGGGDLRLAALPNIALSLVNIALVWRLTRDLAGPRAAALAAMLLAVHQTSATFAALYMSETLFTALLLAAMLALTRAGRGGRDGPGGRDGRDGRSTLRHYGAAALRRYGAAALRRYGAAALRRYGAAALAGALLGLAALTRSAALPFALLAAGWLAAGRIGAAFNRTGEAFATQEPVQRHDSSPANASPLLQRHDSSAANASPLRIFAHASPLRTMVPAAALLFACALTIAPWTLRNALAYGRPILIETGLSYNLWLFNEPRETRQQISAALYAIPNPAERADFATAKGLARLREDPMILLRKLWPNWIYLTRVKPIQDRFLQEDYRGDPPPALFASALLLDDGWYLLVAVGGIWGLARARPGPLRTLTLLWCALCVATILLTHGEARYRHFLLPVLLPFVAAALVGSARLQKPSWPSFLRFFVVTCLPLLVTALLLWPALTDYPAAWAWQELRRGWHAQLGDWAAQRADWPRAAAEYRSATDVQDTTDGWVRRGVAAEALGDAVEMEAAYRKAMQIAASYPPAHARLGAALRTAGDLDSARAVFGGAPAAELDTWSWRELRIPPPNSLSIGDGLDHGWVQGFAPPEQQQGLAARWTSGRGAVRLAAPPNAPLTLRIDIAAPRQAPQTPVALCIGQVCRQVNATETWRSYRVTFPPQLDSAVVVQIESTTFQADGRTLGVLVSGIGVR